MQRNKFGLCFFMLVLIFVVGITVKASATTYTKIVTMNVGEQKWLWGYDYYTISDSWDSNDDSIISIISSSTSEDCKVQAMKAGTATVIYKHWYNQPTLEWDDYWERYKTVYERQLDVIYYDITVKQPPTGIEMAPSLSIVVGDSYTLTPSFTPSGSSSTLTWTSSDTSIAEVNNGKITTKAVGSTNITAVTFNNLSTVCKVTVTRPDKPVLVKIKSVQYNAIEVFWNNTNNADGYEVYRKTNTSGWTLLGTVKQGVASYVDNTVISGQLYTYTVKAYRTINSSNIYSDYDTVGMNGKAVPATPSLHLITLGDPSGNYLHWSLVEGATYYEICRKVGNGSYQLLKTTPERIYIDKNVTSSASYKVCAVRTDAGNNIAGNYSKEQSSSPNTSQISLKAEASGFDRVNLSWNAISGSSGYQIYRSTSTSGTYVKVASISGSQTAAYTNTGLSSGKAYYYKIRPYVTVADKSNYGIFSSVITAKASNVKIKVGTKSLKVYWEIVKNAKGYIIVRSSSTSGTYTEVGRVSGASTLSFSDMNVVAEQTFYYKVAPYTDANGNIKLGYSSIVSAMINLAKPELSLDNESIADLLAPHLKWKTVFGANGYSIYQSINDSEYEKIANVEGGNITEYRVKIGGDFVGKKFDFKIRAFVLINGKKVYSPFSDLVSVSFY